MTVLNIAIILATVLLTTFIGISSIYVLLSAMVIGVIAQTIIIVKKWWQN